MTQRERDRLVALKKAQRKQITQKQASEEMGVSERQVRRLLAKLKETGDRAVIHGLRGRPSNRKQNEEQRAEAVRILSRETYRGFGPTLASEYLASKHKVRMGRESVRRLMIGAGLWRSRRQKVEAIHQWRERRQSRGELVQWDTSEHDWLEGRGGKLYLIAMIDDATSELTARFAPHDSTEENLRLLRRYLQRNGRPVAFYTDKASLFHTTPKVSRNDKLSERDAREPQPPTQIGRALAELGIVWIAAHSPQAKGRIERSFCTAQDRLVKGLRVAGARTIEEANRYLEHEFLPWWNQHLVAAPANPTDAHRPLGAAHDLASSLSRVGTRQVAADYTFQFESRLYQIERASIRAGLRGSSVRIERRLDGTVVARFSGRELAVKVCPPKLKPPAAAARAERPRAARPPTPSPLARRSLQQLFRKPGPPAWLAAKTDRVRISDSLD